nr:hypothetical protein [Oceanococcus sp. HetDA_MAG_MS8]
MRLRSAMSCVFSPFMTEAQEKRSQKLASRIRIRLKHAEQPWGKYQKTKAQQHNQKKNARLPLYRFEAHAESIHQNPQQKANNDKRWFWLRRVVDLTLLILINGAALLLHKYGIYPEI